jgi:hypothetical protein
LANPDNQAVGYVDVAITLVFTSVAFLTGFCVRGLFSEGNADEWPVIDRPSGRYEPPRRHERL